MLKKKRFLLLAAVIITAAFIIFCNKRIENSSDGRLYSDVADIPFNQVGLLLGTGKYLVNGSINPYYAYRIDATKKLLEAGKIKYLIISGDNSKKIMMSQRICGMT